MAVIKRHPSGAYEVPPLPELDLPFGGWVSTGAGNRHRITLDAAVAKGEHSLIDFTPVNAPPPIESSQTLAAALLNAHGKAPLFDREHVDALQALLGKP